MYQAYWADRLFVGRNYLNDPGTLHEARKAICRRLRHDRLGRYPLWANRAIHKMQAGDSVDVMIGRNGYNLWATYYITKA